MLELSCEGDLRLARIFNRSFGGDTFNTAVSAARLGSSVTFVTRFGSDAFALPLQEMMNKEGIHIAPAKPAASKHCKGSTGAYFVAVDAEGQREFAYYRKDSAASYLSPDDITPQLIQEAKIVFASGITLAISETARQAVLKAFRLAQEAGVMTAFDPNYRPALWENEGQALDALNEILPLVDVFLPSFPDDTALLVDLKRPEQVLEYFLFKGVKVVALKAGPYGCYIGYKRETQHIPALSLHAVDTTGAGDAFNGGFLHGLVNSESLLDCARLGITTASLKVMNRGTAAVMPSRESVMSRAFAR